MDIKVKLFAPQIKALKSNKEVVLLLTSRGAGKSTLAVYWIIKKFVEQPHVLGFIGTPSHSQTNDLMTKLVNVLADIGLPYVLAKMPPASWRSTLADHSNYLSVLLPGNKLCQCRYATLANYEASRGISIGWMVIDEAALVDIRAYREVLLPALRGYGTDHQYQQLLLTTPRGVSNWVSELLDKPNVDVIRAPASSNFIEFNDEKIESFRNVMSDRQFRQEILGEIVNITDRTQFHGFSLNAVKEVKIDNNFKMAITSDQNVNPLTASLIYYKPDMVYIAKEIFIEGGTVNDLMASLSKFPELKNKNIGLYGDRSGNNKSVVSEHSFYKQLIDKCKAISIELSDRTLQSNPIIYDSRELVNAWLEKNKLIIDPGCKHLIKDMEKAQYTSDFKTDKKHYDPHLADAVAYFFWKQYGKKGSLVPGNLN